MKSIEIKFKWRGLNFKAIPCGYNFFMGQCRWAIYDEYGKIRPYYNPLFKNYPVMDECNKHFFHNVFPKSKYSRLTPEMKESKLIKKFMEQEAKKFTVVTLKSKETLHL